MLTSEQKQQFDEQGFLAVEGVLHGDLLNEIREAARVMSHAEPPSVKRRVWHERALFRRPAFRKLLDAPALTDAARILIGEDVQLLALDLLMVRAGAENADWHRDINFVCSKTLSMNTGIYLQDTSEGRGPLRVVPGSHRWEHHPPSQDPLPGEITVPVKAGTAVFFDAALWHAAGKNESEEDRLAIFPYFGHYWIKRMDNYFTQPLPADLLAAQDPLKRQLLGLGLREGIPSYHGDNEGYNQRGEPGIDYPSE